MVGVEFTLMSELQCFSPTVVVLIVLTEMSCSKVFRIQTSFGKFSDTSCHCAIFMTLDTTRQQLTSIFTKMGNATL